MPITSNNGTSAGKRKPTLAIVSSYDRYCGIAAYTRRLARYLADDFDVEVIPLDQIRLRGETKRMRELGNRHIDEIAKRLRSFDYVNQQYEPGTLAGNAVLAVRRLKTMLDASRSYSITFHTFDRSVVDWAQAAWDLAKLRPRKVYGDLNHGLRAQVIGDGVFRKMLADTKTKPVSAIVHTKREASYLKLQYGMENVFDHPLSFLTEHDIRVARETATRETAGTLADLPADVKIVGTFGFISPYKGTTAAIRALRHLPENYHLAIFGGLHPNEVKLHEELNEYLHQVISTISGITPEPTGEHSGLERIALDALRKGASDLTDRVHFMGAPDDEGFVRGMQLCDVIALPYLEVGQTSSGPISMAIELERPIVAARNRAFAQFARYHSDRFDFFEVGNHLEMAQRIQHPLARPSTPPAFSYKTNRSIYRAAHGLPADLPETPSHAASGIVEPRTSSSEPATQTV